MMLKALFGIFFVYVLLFASSSEDANNSILKATAIGPGGTHYISIETRGEPMRFVIEKPEGMQYLQLQLTEHNNCTLTGLDRNGTVITEGKCDDYRFYPAASLCHIHDPNISVIRLQMQSFGLFKLSYRWMNSDEALDLAQGTLFLGIFYAIFTLLFLFILYLYTQSRYRFLLYYALYIAGAISYFLLWPDTSLLPHTPPYSLFESNLAVTLTWIGLFFFSLTLLELDDSMPKAAKIVRYGTGVLIVTGTLTAIGQLVRSVSIYQTSIMVGNMLVILLELLLLVSALLLIFKGNRAARYYAPVWGILLGGIAVNNIHYITETDTIFASTRSLMGLVLFEGVAFFFLIAYRLRELHKIAKAYERLKTQQQRVEERSFLLDAVAHQWRQPLNVINGVVFERRLGGCNSIEDENAFDTIEHMTNLLSATIEEFDPDRLEKRDGKTFDLFDALTQSLSMQRSSIVSLNVSVAYDDQNLHCTLPGSKLFFSHVCTIVLNNAFEAFVTGSIKEGCIKIDSTQTPTHCRLRIEDNAGGLADAVKHTLFNEAASTKKGHKGVGLQLARKIMSDHFGGTISLSESNEGVVCTIEVPLDV